MLLLLACGTDPGDDTKPVDTATVDSGESGDTAPIDTTDTADTGESGDTAATETADTALDADLLFDGTPAPLLGFGAEIWPADTRWTTALEPMSARLVRISLNANLGSTTLPISQTPEEWDAWLLVHGLAQYPGFLDDLLTSQALTDARGIEWIAHPWEASPDWEDSSGVILPERVADHAALIGAQMGWLADNGILPRWLELTNEPDGNWNTYMRPADYDALLVAVRDDLDARGLDEIGIVGPGLAVLGGWDVPPEYVPGLSDAGVAALDAWSVHTWDDYAEAGEGHAFLEARWKIFTDQVTARDATKPILVTEMGSKDLSFDGANYASPDVGTCGFVASSDGYAIRMLAHVAVALTAGADGISWWEGADQTWECTRWGMVDVDGRPKRFAEALAAALGEVPDDAGTVLPVATDLPAVAMLGETRGVVLVVNDGADRLRRTVAVTGGWTLASATGFGTEERVLFDELVDFAQLSAVDAAIGIDGTNATLLGDDGARAYRSAAGDAAMTWTPGGEIVSATLTWWSWTGVDPVSVRVEASADGVSWDEAALSEVITTADWNRHDGTVTVPPGTRALRVVLPAEGTPAWNPQLGDVAIRWRRDDPAELPSGAAPWSLDLPPQSAVILTLQR